MKESEQVTISIRVHVHVHVRTVEADVRTNRHIALILLYVMYNYTFLSGQPAVEQTTCNER